MDHPASVSHLTEARSTFFDDADNLLKVGSASPTHAVATALVRAIQEGRAPIMRAIGHGAVGQAVKAQIVARGIAAPLGIDLVFLPAFDNVMNEDGDGTLSAVIWRVLWR